MVGGHNGGGTEYGCSGHASDPLVRRVSTVSALIDVARSAVREAHIDRGFLRYMLFLSAPDLLHNSALEAVARLDLPEEFRELIEGWPCLYGTLATRLGSVFEEYMSGGCVTTE